MACFLKILIINILPVGRRTLLGKKRGLCLELLSFTITALKYSASSKNVTYATLIYYS